MAVPSRSYAAPRQGSRKTPVTSAIRSSARHGTVQPLYGSRASSAVALPSSSSVTQTPKVRPAASAPIEGSA